MASFTDQVQGFNPYIPTLNVDDKAAVGMLKQQQFDAGVQKIQAQVDHLLGLPIAKEQTQAYVKSKVGELRNGLSKSITGDFSDKRLLSQAGGYASRIANDP